jgi:4-hydroxy-3-methylbut-2-enyl diphosphate reductase
VRLVEVAQRAGCTNAMLVERASEIDWSRIDGISRLGVSAGASAPETLVDEIIEAFAQRFDIRVAASGTQRESIVFNLPRELRAPASA